MTFLRRNGVTRRFSATRRTLWDDLCCRGSQCSTTRPGSARSALNPLLPLRALGEYPILRSLALTFVLLGLAGQVIFSTWVLYT
ncbi:hypothetical protein, partial [uncultured Hyphomicrobium sp.]|uniref:hypothetical protein n=1 Tax=uncultured Hyphomicrobium sp. TaxID=194373 RepID=UPI0025CC6152